MAAFGLDIWVILRSIGRMNMAVGILRGWRDCLLADSAVSAEKRQDFSRLIEKYLMAAERNGWAVGVESMKGYIALGESALAVDGQWEEGRDKEVVEQKSKYLW